MSDQHLYRTTGQPSRLVRVCVWGLGVLRRVRRPATAEDWIGAVFIALLAVSVTLQVLATLVQTLLAVWWTLPSLLAVGGGGAWAWGWSRGVRARAAARRLQLLSYTLEEIDAMTPTGFEEAVRKLMIRDGITSQRVGGSNDRAADVIGRHAPTGLKVVVQCKHTTTGAKVPPKVIYEVNGTAGPAHGADVAVVVTNGGFSVKARQCAREFRMALIDRDTLELWAGQGASVVDLLALGSVRGRRYRLRHRNPDRVA
ncbi:restriction endonuclease [Actinomadura sp. NBRC 104412]|uniref:restriction endonuclease n=1 Tax=Actinomadura sp. NBRC 104412 TaxID=3032203 RepID=UPI0024A22E39|nr:restriction endonuclease [Actinomadura sp. NBRC 104412]GLZ09250.1 restriction endonuclease [Actinomadura sp. NBRC 104412]